MELGNVLHLENQNLPTKQVILYPDRAEVKRLVEFNLPKGQAAVFIELTELEAKRAQIGENHQNLNDEIYVVKKRLEVLDGVATQIGHNIATKSDERKPAPAFILCNEAMENLTGFIEYYGKTASELRKYLREKELRLDIFKSDMDSLDRQIDQLRCRLEYDTKKRTLRIDVEMEKEGNAGLFFSYQVYCAAWRPAYDIRASTSTGCLTEEGEQQDSGAVNSVDLYYYGLVEQNTDENWTDVELLLSTATPCVAGTAPFLPSMTVGLQKPQLINPHAQSTQRKLSPGHSEEDMGIGSFEYNDYTDAMALHRMTIAHSTTDSDLALYKDQLPCVCFPIEAPATVLSNGQSHRVLIAKLDLKPIFFHDSVPSKTPSAFLSAVINNSSSMPLLHGQSSIFLNNSFICTQSLRTVLPNEDFRCVFGVDPSVKVEYKTLSRTKEQIGFVSKNMLSTNHSTIVLRNAKFGERVQVTVREPIPKSLDEKIKIYIVSPELRSGRATDARLSKDNHLEWLCELEPGELKELNVKWNMEYPLHDHVVYGSASLNRCS